jgi:hypothetical protein
MPYIPDNEWSEHKKKFDEMQRTVEDHKDLLKKVKGELIIQGFGAKRLDLNDNLNVIELLKRITNIETRVTALE